MTRIPSLLRSGVALEDKLAAYLTDASRRCVGGLTKLAALRIANYITGKKVSVVEDVEHLNAEVEGCSFSDLGVFLYPQIRIDRSRPGEQELLRAPSHAANLVAAAKVIGKG